MFNKKEWTKKYRKTHKDNIKEENKRYRNRNPWVVSYSGAKKRCLSGKYKDRGRKFLMTKDDFKFLWFRDKAGLMKKPSIDRIDNNGDYVLSNCRFIELSENVSRSRRAQR